MTRLAIIAIALILAGCSAEKRLQRLLDKHPELNDTTRITLVDTVLIPGDTLFRPVILRTTDTVTVTNERQTVRLVRVPTGGPCDTAAIHAEILATIAPDTVVVVRTVEVPRVVPCPPGKQVASWWRTVAIVLALVLLAFILFKRP